MAETIVKKKVAVVGSRTFADRGRLYEVLTKNRDRIKLIISGGAKGADSLSVDWATDYGIPYLVFPALWRDPDTGELNRGAGFKRNVLIVDQADVVMAFWDGKSTGTAHTIEMAKQRNKPVRIISFTEATPKLSVPVDIRTGKLVETSSTKTIVEDSIIRNAYTEPHQANDIHEAIAEPPPEDDSEATL